MTRFSRGVALLALSATVVLIACKEGARAGAGPNYTATPTPLASPTASPIPLALGSSAAGAILTPGHADLYRFTIGSTSTLVELDIDAEALHPVTNKLDSRLSVYSPDGTLFATADDGTTVKDKRLMKDAFLRFTASQSGTWTVAVDDANGGGGPAGFDYVLRASKPVPVAIQGGNDCLNAVLLTSLDLSLTGDTTGAFPSTCCGVEVLPCVGSAVSPPERVYKAILSSGQTIQAVRTGPAFDGALYLTNSCGITAAQIEAACAIGGDGRDEADGIVFTPAVTGTYYLYVDGVSATAATAGSFQLDLRRF